jgi:hypothetical protein
VNWHADQKERLRQCLCKAKSKGFKHILIDDLGDGRHGWCNGVDTIVKTDDLSVHRKSYTLTDCGTTDNAGSGPKPTADNAGSGPKPTTDNAGSGPKPTTDNAGSGPKPTTDNAGSGPKPTTDNEGSDDSTTDNAGSDDSSNSLIEGVDDSIIFAIGLGLLFLTTMVPTE